MNTITKSNLESLVNSINIITGNPREGYTKTDQGYVSNPGNYHLYWAYGKVGLDQIDNESGGSRNVFGLTSKRELYSLMGAFILGFQKGAK